METGLTQDEIHLLLKDMTDVCLRPPEEEAWRVAPAPEGLGQERSSPLIRLCRGLDSMRPWSLLLVAAAAVAPLAAVTFMVAFIGPLASLVLLAVSAAVGALVILQQGRVAFRSLAQCLYGMQTGRSLSRDTVRRALRVLSGILLLLPDPLTSCAGLLLLLPDVHEGLTSWLQRQTSPALVLG